MTEGVGSGPDGIRIRPLEGPEERGACVRLQEETWGDGFSERVPGAILLVAARLGGVVSGAFDSEGTLVGFVFGLTGLEGGRPVHWSDMLAVRPAYRGRGIGTALKLHQRERLLEMGVTRMYWSFDPLEARNAHLNFGRLGAVAREYVESMYGESDSPLHRGIGTDRFIVLWELDADRPRRRIGGEEAPPGIEDLAGLPSALEAGEEDGDPSPGAVRTDLEAPGILVAVPGDVQALKARAPALARRWREATRTALGGYLARGWEAREVVRSGNIARYLLVREEDGPSSGTTAREDADERQ